MKKLKIGTPLAGIIIGSLFALAGVLVMLIGFWKAIVLIALFGIGYFLGSTEEKVPAIKGAIRKIVPDKTPQPINIKEEIYREQAQSGQRMVFSFEDDAEPATDEAKE